jgi:hypothetical protein
MDLKKMRVDEFEPSRIEGIQFTINIGVDFATFENGKVTPHGQVYGDEYIQLHVGVPTTKVMSRERLDRLFALIGETILKMYCGDMKIIPPKLKLKPYSN